MVHMCHMGSHYQGEGSNAIHSKYLPPDVHADAPVKCGGTSIMVMAWVVMSSSLTSRLLLAPKSQFIKQCYTITILTDSCHVIERVTDSYSKHNNMITHSQYLCTIKTSTLNTELKSSVRLTQLEGEGSVGRSPLQPSMFAVQLHFKLVFISIIPTVSIDRCVTYLCLPFLT